MPACRIIIGVLILAFSVAAKSQSLCPEKIETNQTLSTSINGYEPFVEEVPNRLNEVEFYMLHPRELACIERSSSEEDDKTISSLWQFSEIELKSGIFMKCKYSNSTISLINRVEEDRNSCKVKYSKTNWASVGKREILSIECLNKK